MITVDKDLCIGCGACVAVCSSAFKMADDGKSEAIAETADCAADAAAGCPVQAIAVS